MTMTARIAFVCLAALAFLPGCSSILFKTSKAPELYQVPYVPQVVSCPCRFSQGVRIWVFSAAAPLDRPNMVVRDGDQQVLLSRDNQWVASPGAMVTEHLYRDLTQGSIFSEVTTGATPRDLPLTLTGRIFDFAWVKEGATSRAELKLEATLAGDSQGEGILYFHKVYTLTGDRLLQTTPNTFAEAMGRLLGDFSRRLQSDLCTVARDQGPHPGTR
jgi:ABC-type uncharacterized transport system auxiliary subunit